MVAKQPCADDAGGACESTRNAREMEQHRVLSEIRTNSPQFARSAKPKHAGGNHNNVIDL